MAVPLPNLTGGAGGAAGPSRAALDMMGATSGMFDASGWNVATGGSKTSGGGAIPWIYIIGGGLVALYLWKKR